MEDLRLPSEEVWVTEDVLAGVFATFVEAIHVKLSYERVDISVSEVFGEDVVLEVIDLFDGELPSVGHPVNDRLVVFVLQYFKWFLDEVGNWGVDGLDWHSLYILNFYSLNISN